MQCGHAAVRFPLKIKGILCPPAPAGLACDVCKLKLLNICSSCGPGKSQLAKAKLEAQKRLLGAPCPILACASLKQVDYCLRDCDLFPCENFNCGPYPFSQSFLAMQKRRRGEHPPALTPYRSLVQIPGQFWKKSSPGTCLNSVGSCLALPTVRTV